VKKNSKILVMCAVGGTLDTIVTYRRDKKLFAGGWVDGAGCDSD
jgi:hypothetical protein